MGLMPFFLASKPVAKERFSDPDYLLESEDMFREKFVENLQMVEDIVASVDDNSLERKSEEYTGFRKFLFGALKALDLNVSDYIGGLDVSSVRSLTRTAQGEDPMSG